MTVEVLLATFRSSRFLAEQLHSLESQDFQGFDLIVHDDRSDDNTLEILAQHAKMIGGSQSISVNSRSSGSASNNFAGLIAAARADRVFLADHDDIWHPNKLSRGLSAIARAEATFGTNVPVLYHTNLAVCDGAGTSSERTLWDLKRIVPQRGENLRTALMHPTVTGCTVGMNRGLLDLVRPMPGGMIMHDWFINLVAASFGKVIWDVEPSMKYRIHGENVSRPTAVSAWSRLKQKRGFVDARRVIHRRIDQAEAFLNAYQAKLPHDAITTLQQFIELRNLPAPVRNLEIARRGFLPPGFARALATIVAV